MNETKPGVKTTEFWLTLFSNVLTIGSMVAGALPPKYAVPTATAVNIGYQISRGLTKKGAS